MEEPQRLRPDSRGAEAADGRGGAARATLSGQKRSAEGELEGQREAKRRRRGDPILLPGGEKIVLGTASLEELKAAHESLPPGGAHTRVRSQINQRISSLQGQDFRREVSKRVLKRKNALWS